MSEYTPGPWTFDHDWRRFAAVFGGDGIQIAVIERDKSINGFVYEMPERFANARLITTAPRTLEALKALVADCLEYERINNLVPSAGRKRCWDSLADAEAAIANAEGSPPKTAE